MTLKQFSLFLCVGAVAFAGGCKNDDASPSVPGTQAEITAKLAGTTPDPNSGTSSKKWLPVNDVELDLVSLKLVSKAREDCAKDDTVWFFSNSSFRETTGPKACPGETPDDYSNCTWATNASTKVISICDNEISGVIKQLDDNTLKVEITNPGNSADKATLELKAAK